MNYNKDYEKTYQRSINYIQGYAPSINYQFKDYTKVWSAIASQAPYFEKVYTKSWGATGDTSYTASFTKI